MRPSTLLLVCVLALICVFHKSLWRRGGCARTSRFGMQTRPGAHSQISSTQWFGIEGLCIGKHPCHQRTSWVVEVWWQASRRPQPLSHTRSLLRTWALRLVKPLLQLSWQPTGSLPNMQTSLNLTFLPCDAMHKRGYCRHAVSVRPSVRLSVTFVSCAKTNKGIFEIFSPLGSQAILVFPYQTGWRYYDGNPLTGASNARGCDKSSATA